MERGRRVGGVVFYFCSFLLVCALSPFVGRLIAERVCGEGAGGGGVVHVSTYQPIRGLTGALIPRASHRYISKVSVYGVLCLL